MGGTEIQDLELELRGLKDLVAFADYLDDKRIRHRIHHRRPDALTASCVLVGARLEVDFFSDRVALRAFEGSESVFDDFDWLFAVAEGAEPGEPPRIVDQHVADARKVVKLLSREEFRK